MAIIDDIVAAVQPDLDAIHSSIQEALQDALAVNFSSPAQEANSRAMVAALDESIRNIKEKAVEVYVMYSPFWYGSSRRAVPPAELVESDAEGDLEVVVEGWRVFIRSSRTIVFLVD
jgi:hypothetical protein